jgi:nitrate reductase alpha subunit
MAMGHVILREFFLERTVPYFQDYCRRYTDLPMLVQLRRDGDRYVPDRYVRHSEPVKRLALADGEALVATVFDLLCANYGIDRGLGGVCAKCYADNTPYTPRWQQAITGVP